MLAFFKFIGKFLHENILVFINEYLKTGLTLKGIEYSFDAKETEYFCYFDSASVGLIIDNIFSNSLKAHSDKLTIRFKNDKDSVTIGFYDNGTGLRNGISPSVIFEYGATTTNNSSRGFGIGLCHIKQLANDMGGDVVYDEEYSSGFGLIVRLKK